MGKKELLQRVTNYYINSGDFNGLPDYEIPSSEIEDLVALIEDDLVRILTEDDDVNIYINRCNCFAEKEEQIKAVHKKSRCTIYPTQEHLATMNIRENKPFTEMLAQGVEQFHIMYFAVDVLELYINNPQYAIWDCGYRGNICIRDWDDEQADELHSEYIHDFGIAYPVDEPRDRDRAVAVFLRDLAKLNYEAQCKWRGFLLRNQKEFRVNYGFIKNLLYADWVTEYWIFDALLDEIKLINAMCNSIGIPQLFRKEYSRENQELIGYRIILIPSLKNYYEFVSALEKIVINNLSYDTFQKDTLGIASVERKKDDGTLKGSIEMLDEWFSSNYFRGNVEGCKAFKKYISGTFRTIRKIRQVPAHELYSNKHDKDLYRKQNELIEDVYRAVRDLRMMFSKHPSAKKVIVPEQLSDEENIVIY